MEFDRIMDYDVSNRIVYTSLCKEIQTESGILPFVGAGISAFTYEVWSEVLLNLSRGLNKKDQKAVKDAVKKGDYFSASDLLCEKYGEVLFYKELRDIFSEDKIIEEELKKNAAFLIPKLCKGDCITTNFDRVLEFACNLNGIVPDKAFPGNTQKLNDYLRSGHKKSGLIFKIHGDILSNKEDIVLTGKSYDKHYAKDTPLRKQLTKWIDSRKLLFLGASLKEDRTVNIIKERMEEGMYNYAVYGCKKSEIAKLKEHFKKLNTFVIFYDSGDHRDLKVLLEKLIEDTGKK